MYLRNVMDLTKHGGLANNSAVFTGEQFGLSHNVCMSNLPSQFDNLVNKRKQSVDYLSEGHLKDTFIPVIGVILQCISHGGKIMAAGNGGSAAQSQHFCSELMGRLKNKRSPIPAISLSSDISLITCIANDYGYERIFSRQIEGLGKVHDVFMAFTTSGKSRNIIEALYECKSQGIFSVVFTGGNTDNIKQLADYVVEVPDEDTAIVQEIHMQLIHILCEIVECNLVESISVWDEVLKLGHEGYKCLILDRDGVINHVKANGYVSSTSEFVFRKDFLNHIKPLSETFRYIFVVSNQKGIGKGLMTMEELENVHEKMIENILNHGGRIDKIYVSTSADNNAIDNKPNTGLANKIIEEFPNVDFNNTVVVGDSASDYLFADKLKSKFVYARTR